MARTVVYWDYLKLDRLLGLQSGLEDDESSLMPDELHFITVHQVFELWFKLVLRELRVARDHLAAPRVAEETVPFVVHHLGRVSEILRLGVDQFRVMETLTPQDFLAFRDKLTPASGLQSFQLREIEILLGLDETQRVASGQGNPMPQLVKITASSPTGDWVKDRLESAAEQLTLRQALHDWLYRTPIQGSSPDDHGDERHVETFIHEYLRARESLAVEQINLHAETNPVEKPDEIAARFQVAGKVAREFLEVEDRTPDGTTRTPEEKVRLKRIRAALLFIESYRDLPLLAWPRLLIDTVVELEEMLVLWRTRHARMVERIIGRRVGTGGSEGVEYLDRTTRARIFPELWAVRAILLPRSHLPDLKYREFYGFAR